MKRSTVPSAFAAALAAFVLPLLARAEGPHDFFSHTLATHGWLAAMPAAFLVGVATAATPCVYPMIVITVSVFGARNASRGRAAALSTAFVLGIAALFVPLGLIAGLTGTVAGRAAGLPAVQIFEAVLMFAMALSMFGIYEISLPPSVQNRLASVGGLGLKGAFVIGMALGPIAAPCATGGLIGILDYVFQTKNAWVGGGALFAYSMGLGAPFWVVGTFALVLPKSGYWMNHVKNALGVVLVATGLWYLRHVVPGLQGASRFGALTPWVFAAITVVGLALGAVHLSVKEGTGFQKARKIVGVALATVGGVWWITYEPAAAVHEGSAACTPIVWQQDLAAAQALAQREGRPMLIDFGATWCPACEELAHTTFVAHDVACAASSARVVAVKIYDDDGVRPANLEDLNTRYHVRGLPTVILLDAQGRESARTTEFVPAAQMVTILRRVDSRTSAR